MFFLDFSWVSVVLFCFSGEFLLFRDCSRVFLCFSDDCLAMLGLTKVPLGNILYSVLDFFLANPSQWQWVKGPALVLR